MTPLEVLRERKIAVGTNEDRFMSSSSPPPPVPENAATDGVTKKKKKRTSDLCWEERISRSLRFHFWLQQEINQGGPIPSQNSTHFGASINDILKIFGFFDPLSPLSRLIPKEGVVNFASPSFQVWREQRRVPVRRRRRRRSRRWTCWRAKTCCSSAGLCCIL